MPSPPPLRQICRYQILSELGRGSMGRVYLALDPRIDRRIALKVLMPERLRGGDAGDTRQRFLREARAAGRLTHEGIVTVYDADTDPESGCPYLAMEWIPGGTLKLLLRRDGRLPIARAVAVAAQVARALDYAHRRAVVHRDVKPANLLVTGDGRVKIVDFGIAKLQSQSITLPGHLLGSPYYMSPEQVGGHPVDGRADLFALGAVLYEALTAQVAFRDESVSAVTHKILTAEPCPIERLRPGVPASLQAVVGRALAKLPGDRFQTGAELAAALETVGAELVLGQAPGAVSGALLARQEGGSETLPLSGSTAIVERSAPASTVTLAAPARRGLRAVILAALMLVGILIGRWPARLATPEAELLAMDSRALDRPPTRPATAEEAPSGETPPEVPPEEKVQPMRGIVSGEPFDPLTAAPALETRAPGSAVLPNPAVLEIVHENRLRHAVLNVRIDGEEALSVELRTKNPLTLVAGRQHRWMIPIAAGERSLEVRVSGISKRFEAHKEVAAVFAAGESRRLRIEAQPGRQELVLAWLE